MVEKLRSLVIALGLVVALGGMLALPAKAGDDENKQVELFVLGNTLFTLYHELGHALIDKFRIPVLGKEEDAVDGLATILMLPDEPEEADETSDELILSAGDGYALAHERGTPDELAFWDEHSMDLQRFAAVNCLVFGSDPEGFAELAQQIEMPEYEQQRCPETYQQTNDSWLTLLDQHFREDGDTRGGKIRIRFEAPGRGIDPDLVRFLKGTDAFENAVAVIEEALVLPEDFRVVFASCGEINAFYDPGTGDVTMCYEIIAYFAELITEDQARGGAPGGRVAGSDPSASGCADDARSADAEGQAMAALLEQIWPNGPDSDEARAVVDIFLQATGALETKDYATSCELFSEVRGRAGGFAGRGKAEHSAERTVILTFENNARQSVTELYVSETDDRSGEENLLGDQPLRPGDSIEIDVADAGASCLWSITVAFRDGLTSSESGVDLCRGQPYLALGGIDAGGALDSAGGATGNCNWEKEGTELGQRVTEKFDGRETVESNALYALLSEAVGAATGGDLVKACGIYADIRKRVER